jgi:hypothetical protein
MCEPTKRRNIGRRSGCGGRYEDIVKAVLNLKVWTFASSYWSWRSGVKSKLSSRLEITIRIWEQSEMLTS